MNRKYAYLTVVENKKRRGNADKEYTVLVNEDMRIFFFTEEEMNRAEKRALQNREDITPVEVSYEVCEK